MRNRHYGGVMVSIFAALVSACGPMPPGPASKDGGFVELDESTEPRFVSSLREGPIGTLRTVGNDVRVNNSPVRGPRPIYNNDFVTTGPRSGARIDFRGSPTACSIGILDFRLGRLYGNTGGCSLRIETIHAGARTDQRRVRYHVGVYADGYTEITVIRGVMEAWPKYYPGQRVTVGSGHEVTVRPDAIEGPYEVDTDARTSWRDKFPFGGGVQADGDQGKNRYCESYARTAVEHANQNRQRGCDFHGSAWDSRYQRHFDWCMSRDDYRSAARSENRSRERMLARCRADAQAEKQRLYCKGYAETAVEQNEENERRRCGFRGRSWNSNIRSHFDWCMSGDNYRTAAPSEERSRRRQLAECAQTVAQIRVPNLRGKTLREAAAELRRVRLKVGTVKTEGGGGDRTIVVRQSPPAGRHVREGTAVDLTLQPVVY